MISPHKEMAGDRRKLLYFRTGMFNPIKHFLVPLCCCFCSPCGTISPGPWLWGTGGAQAGAGASLPDTCWTRAGCWRCLWESRGALMGGFVLWGSLLELPISFLAQCFVQPLTQDVGAGAPEHPKVRATAATNNLSSFKQHPGRVLSLILKEMDCLNVPLGLVGNGLGFISGR